MPTCNDCGNTTEFVHEVHGMELRSYDGSEHQDTYNRDLETRSVQCNRCGSENITFDTEEATHA